MTTRGARDLRWGPVLDTTIEHNSTYQTGSGSIGVSCALGCDGSVLHTESNIFWAEARPLSADGDFPNHRDIYWSSSGHPNVTTPHVDPTAIFADPLYSDPTTGTLRLRPSSPAIGRGRRTGRWSTDAYGITIPHRIDVGAAQSQ